MTLRRYERYKDSGVEWLGAVPAHWTVTRLKFIAHVQTGVAKGKDNSGRQTVLVPYLRVANVQDGYLDLEDVATIEIPANDLPRYRLRVGDVLMNEGGDFDKLGRGHVWDGTIDPCIHQNHVFAVRPFGVSPQWLNLITGSAYAQYFFMSRSKQSTNLASISSTNVMELPIVLPPANEQEAITGFLAREAAAIETLISEQQRLIELLTEKRQAVISKAVTKGLIASAPLKDSGVEWLGQVPAHWKVSALKHIVATPITDGPHETPNFLNEGVPFVSAEAISSGEINFDKIRGFISPEDHLRFSAKYLPRRGDIYMVKSGATTGVTAIVETDAEFNIWSPLAVIRCDRVVDPYFILNFMRSRNFLESVTLNWSFGTQQNIGMRVIENLAVPVPPIDEQRGVVAFLADRTGRLDALIGEALKATQLLQERRTALISAAVTGQIDVRNSASVESALAETRADIAAGRYVVESAAAHVARVQAMATADEHPPSPPHSC